MACCLHFTQRSFNRESSKQAAINAVLLDCHNFVLCAYIFEYFSSLHAKKKSPGSISFLHSSRCQTCVFTRPSAFQSLFVAQMIILLFSDAYPPYLCLGKSYTSWKGHLMKPSLIMPFGQFFFPHMWFNRFFCGLNRYVV